MEIKSKKWCNHPTRNNVVFRILVKNRIIVEVDIAYKNKIISQTRHNIWEGRTPSGIKVEGYIAPNTTVYPLQ